MNKKYKIAGAVILYNPDEKVFKNIKSYINQVDKLYIIDNSNSSNDDIISSLDSSNIIYKANLKNIGLAAALNLAAKLAILDGYDFLLTMDQDSSAPVNMISDLILKCEKFHLSTIGIISPFHSVKNYKKPNKDIDVAEVLTVMTSGNLLNLSIYSNIGTFQEKLFIDYIDYEYCLRLNSLGYKVLIVNTTELNHNLGDLEERKFLFRKIAVTNHTPERLYYRTRNRFTIINMYKNIFPGFCRRERIGTISDFIKVIFYEKNKLNKLKMIFKGIKDFRQSSWGELKIT